MAVEEVERIPAVGGLLRRAVAGAIRGGDRGDLPDRELRVRDVAVDPDHLRRYARVCEFRLSSTVPPTYPHVLAFPLSLDLMTRPDFPFPLVGLVHVSNTIEVVRPIDTGERMDLAVRADNLRQHERGRAVDVVATASVGGETVWRGRSGYLRRTKETPAARARGGHERAQPPGPSAVWRIGVDVGSAYAEVSGDRNPIHTSTLGARLFGFPRRIAHGMWSKARCLAALEGRLPDRFTVDVAFKQPVPLPTTVAFSASVEAAGGWRFALHDASSGRPHLIGTVTVTPQPARP